jgi:hypothetical protein
MAMDHQSRSPHSPDPTFVRFMQAHEQAARQYAEKLVRCNQFLGSPDQDDIYVQGMTKLWQAYFCEKSKQPYHYHNQRAEWSLIKKSLRDVANDLTEQRRRESSSFRPIELDELDAERVGHRQWSQTDDFTETVNLNLELERFINQQVPGSTLWWVARYLSGQISRVQVDHYTAGNLRTSETRLRQKFKVFLRESYSFC